MPNNRMQIVIAGVALTISTVEEESYVERLVQTIDEDMQSLLGKTKASVTSAALLLAIDYLDRFQKANIASTNMRTQIKGYLTDAANAKLLFDEEKKRSDMYAREVGELNSRLEQALSSSSRSDGNEEIKMLMEQNSLLLEERTNMINQLDYANNLLNTSISAREEEIAKLQNDAIKYIEQLEHKTNQSSNYEHQLQVRQEEIDKLLSEVTLLENLLSERIKEEKTPPIMQNYSNDFGTLGNYSYEEKFVSEAPPLFYQESSNDLPPYEYDDMPNLNWTENI